ncbi:hypothetical protein LCUFL03_70008 [Latilactobacillus curvatus]|nr:hypothetical protein LCUFL03_70008 [Latilactobacillus curvatus]
MQLISNLLRQHDIPLNYFPEMNQLIRHRHNLFYLIHIKL